MDNDFSKNRTNVNTTKGNFVLSEEALRATSEQQNLEQSVKAKHLASTIKVPTSDKEAIERLRQLGEPVCFFGEKAGDRRERLKTLMAELMAAGKNIDFNHNLTQKIEHKEEVENNEVFYTEGNQNLRAIRFDILEHSLKEARKRIEIGKNSNSFDAKKRKMAIFGQIEKMECQESEIGDVRPLSCLSISENGRFLAVGSWSGMAKIWDLKSNVEMVKINLQKNKRITDIKFFPNLDKWSDKVEENQKTPNLAISCFDGTLKLWDGTSKSIKGTINAHSKRLSKMAFLPKKENLLITTSFDKSWSLWDLNKEKNVFRQTGHSAETYAVAVHPDCSLCITGDLSGIARIWDLRSGQAILNLRGHVRQVLSADFSPNGFHVATGSGDCFAKIWDLRAKNLLYSIPAHSMDITSVKFEKNNGHCLLTSSFDKKIKIWSAKTFKLRKTLIGHEDKISDCDFEPKQNSIFSVSFDRTWKRWE